MLKVADMNSCERQEELISYLYGEITNEGALVFERHLVQCSACSAEFASFDTIRSSIGRWKNEALSGIATSEELIHSPAPKKSAVAACKQFFDLSPLWLRGAVAFGSVLFCLLALITVARFARPTNQVRTTQNPDAVYTRQDVEAAVKAAIAQARPSSSSNENVATTVEPSQPKLPTHSGKKVSSEIANRRPLTKAEREQLAADLRLTNKRDDNSVDLLGDRINY
jgi:anti-sigma factor RsiW